MEGIHHFNRCTTSLCWHCWEHASALDRSRTQLQQQTNTYKHYSLHIGSSGNLQETMNITMKWWQFPARFPWINSGNHTSLWIQPWLSRIQIVIWCVCLSCQEGHGSFPGIDILPTTTKNRNVFPGCRLMIFTYIYLICPAPSIFCSAWGWVYNYIMISKIEESAPTVLSRCFGSFHHRHFCLANNNLEGYITTFSDTSKSYIYISLSKSPPQNLMLISCWCQVVSHQCLLVNYLYHYIPINRIYSKSVRVQHDRVVNTKLLWVSEQDAKFITCGWYHGNVQPPKLTGHQKPWRKHWLAMKMRFSTMGFRYI